MKTIITIVFLAFSTLTFAQKMPQGHTYDAIIVRVIDGDTVVISAKFLPKPLKPELAVRVYGVDTPEKGFRAKCSSEDSLGKKASEFTKQLISSTKKHQVTLYDWDKYGGRVLGDVWLDGVSLRSELIRNGFAKEYFGDKKQSWCN